MSFTTDSDQVPRPEESTPPTTIWWLQQDRLFIHQPPNLQISQLRRQRGEIRKAFVPRDENHILLAVIILKSSCHHGAEFSGDEIDAQLRLAGVFTIATTCCQDFQVPLEDVTTDMREKSKQLILESSYRHFSFADLSQRLSIPRGEDQRKSSTLIFTEFPCGQRIHGWRITQGAKKTKIVEDHSGRRRYLRDDPTARNMNIGASRAKMPSNRSHAKDSLLESDQSRPWKCNVPSNGWKSEKLKSKMILRSMWTGLRCAIRRSRTSQMQTSPDWCPTAIKMNVPVEVERRWTGMIGWKRH